ncbi:MAG: LysM peptidoglycan-binding domain-containing protein [Halobacteriovoraceae bacterium]|nr:LysM peptidoglycan-binding domain-containing protein [Halobacteriovoraceae bacterium]MCB9095571.1 LysM peptidoglycan-binding domain-containing protein [Halobacteriovoraceae bacterium]
MKIYFFSFLLFISSTGILAQDDELDQLEQEFSDEFGGSIQMDQTGLDDDNTVDALPDAPLEESASPEKEMNSEKEVVNDDELSIPDEKNIKDISIQEENKTFDTGVEESQLLSLAEKISYKLSDEEWQSIAESANVTTSYTVQEGDWLFKISRQLFGSGFYYPKIWALNPYITNPHEIEPGMELVFQSGSTAPPELLLEGEISPTDSGKQSWEREKQRLLSQGVHVDYASEDMEQLLVQSSASNSDEYRKYDPPPISHTLPVPTDEYDDSGFDKTGPRRYKFKQGFSKNTFVTENEIEVFGSIVDGINNAIIFGNGDHVYIKLENVEDPQPGDFYSIFKVSNKKVQHENSERNGYRYAINGHVRLIAERGEKWEAEIFDLTDAVMRDDKLTVYTPKIKRINRLFSTQIIEAVILGSYDVKDLYSLGDIVYLDRGRADGVEVGTVFGVYGREDRMTEKMISEKPTYLNAELTVISLTDQFATALVTGSVRDISRGAYAVTLTEEDAFSKKGARKDQTLEPTEDVQVKEDLGEQVINDSEDLQLNEEELEELDRIENQKSYIDETEKDLEELDDLEDSIDDVDEVLTEEDKKLLDQDLEGVESDLDSDEDELELLEQEKGKVYLDEQLNEKENPYGLSEGDVEEVDELLNFNPEDEIEFGPEENLEEEFE